MKKFFSMVLALVMCLAISTPFANFAFAAEETAYDVEIPEGGNLATNPYNWAIPTLSTAEFTVSETDGVKFNNFVSNQQCTTMYMGGRFGEFKLSMFVDANLNIPGEGKAQWRYSEFFITFLIDRNMEDAIAEDGKPWYANKVYMALSVGLTSGGAPICKFLQYNAFAGNCSMSGQNYVGTATNATPNIADGNKHWIELEVKNYSDETGSGKRCIAYIDGVEITRFDYEDTTYYDADSRKEYDVTASELTGGIGFYANSDWPAGMAPSKMNNWLEIEKMTLISFDANPDGEYVPQCTEPVYEITSKDYVTAASYQVGDPIEIQLSDLFNYEGTKEVTYEVTCNGEAIGTVANGFWAWTPDAAGNYDVDFKATVTEDNAATNYATFRVKGGETTSTPSTSTSEPASTPSTSTSDVEEPAKKGCKGVVGGMSSLVGIIVLAASAVILRKKQD